MFAALSLFLAFLLTGSEEVTVTAERVSDTPLLKPSEDWMARGVFNPAAIKVDNKTILLFRAEDNNHTSRIGYAESLDGSRFTIHPQPLLSPEADYERTGGLEDPRLVKIGETFYLTYTGYDGKSAQLCLATSTDLQHWQRRGVVLPAYKGTWNTQWTKSGAILPQKVNGKWWMYYLGTKTDPDGKARDYMGLASSDDLIHWSDATDKPVLERRPGAFDARVMEPGPAPFVTEAGILLLYNGADEKLVYGPGWALFDKRDPRRLIARSDKPFALPKLSWEREGTVPNVIFLEGAIPTAATEGHGLQVTGYYGAADRFVGALNIRVDLKR